MKANRTFVALAAVAALGAGVLAQQNQQNQQQNPPAQQGVTGSAMRTPTQVQELLFMGMAMSNYFEIASSQAALAKGVSDNVRQFAQRMIADHTRAQQQLEQLARRKNVTNLPGDEGVQNRLIIFSASQLSGKQFEQAYLKAQVDGHENTLTMLQAALRAGQAGAAGQQGAGTQQNPQGNANQNQQGQNNQQNNAQNQANASQGAVQLTGTLDAETRQWAQSTLTVVQGHLAQARQLYATATATQ